MKISTTCFPEARVRAGRMVPEHENERPSQRAALQFIAERIGGSGDTLRN